MLLVLSPATQKHTWADRWLNWSQVAAASEPTNESDLECEWFSRHVLRQVLSGGVKQHFFVRFHPLPIWDDLI